MTHTRLLKIAVVITLFATVILAGMTNNSKRVRARSDDDQNEESKIQRGFEIAPVRLNLDGKNRALVGLGSYIVNGPGDCNGCHSHGPGDEFAQGGNPYLRFPIFSGTKQTNSKTYLAGGRDFGPFGSKLELKHLYSRNLTPDKTGLPEGGHTFGEFVEIMRHGTDFDHLHPNCTDPTGSTPPNCLLPPFNGDLLQVMRWPNFQDMTDHDLLAIYEYLKAVPCNSGPDIPGAPYLKNSCQ